MSVMASTNPGRDSERQKSEDHLRHLLEEGFLTQRAPYNRFQNFLDLKDDNVFAAFRRKLESFAELNKYSWHEMAGDDPWRRNACATRFLASFGKEYWGDHPEVREKYLIADEDTCSWPHDQKHITEAVEILLWKISVGKSKAKRASIFSASTSSSTEPAKSAKPFATQPAQRTQPTEPVTPPSVPAAEQAQPTKASAQTSQTTQHVKLVQSTQADPYKGQVGLLTPSRVKQDESVTPQPIRNTARPTEASLSTQGSIINRDHGPRKPVAEPRADPAADPVAEPVAKSQNDRDRVQIRRHNKPLKICYPTDPAAHDQRTYFLIREDSCPTEARSLGWQMFGTSSELIDRMEYEVSDLGDPSARQLREESNSPRFSYARIHLGWSGTTFVIRRGIDQDLQELVRHVSCAWHADEKGKFQAAEFRIEAILKEKE